MQPRAQLGWRLPASLLVFLSVLSSTLVACSSSVADDGRISVSTTTGIVADVVKQVGGDRVAVTSIVPPAGDPHSYEPTPSDAKAVVGADIVFTNGLLLEDQSITKLAYSAVDEGKPVVPIAENVEAHGGKVIPLVEDLGLEVLWLGLAVQGAVKDPRAEIELRATALEGPGELVVYLTDSLGEPSIYVDSKDGFTGEDRVLLPPEAHTHVNWAFSAPGKYRLSMSAELREPGSDPKSIGEEDFAFVVGGEATGGVVLGTGHTDVTVNLDSGELFARTDESGNVPAADAVLHVTDLAREQVPEDARFSFLGAAGETMWLLPQAVLGKHVHGEHDPHLWQDAKNVKAYAAVVAEALGKIDPDSAELYERNRIDYSKRLDGLDKYVTSRLSPIPLDNRKLVTTHDAFGYLAEAYDLRVVGFVVPNPGQEPSAAQVARLASTIEDLNVAAVFLEPNLAARADVLRRVATDKGVRICTINGDALGEGNTTYEQMMRQNADQLATCLGDSE